jgi:hypothetical protein
MMTVLPLAESARLLGIHPQTLRQWLKEAQMPLSPHPYDTDLQCLTPEQVLQLAKEHGRYPALSAPASLSHLDDAPLVSPFEGQAHPQQGSETPSGAFIGSLPSARASEADLATRWPAVVAQATRSLQEHLAYLAISLLQEQKQHIEQQLAALEVLLQQNERPQVSEQESQEAVAIASSEQEHASWHVPHPAEQRRQPGIPLIEYRSEGRYVVISQERGELPLVPDSPEWFSYLASLSSFRFLGELGRLSAARQYDHGPRRTWYAYRSFHQHMYKHYLGATERLTIVALEQMAARLQAEVTSLSLTELNPME